MNRRDDLRKQIADDGLDKAVYQGGQLPDKFFDGLDDSSSLLQEIDALKAQLVEAKNNPGSIDEMQIGRFDLTPIGLIAPDDATAEEFGHVGQMLFRLEGSLQWLIGDWLVLVDNYHWGDTDVLARHFGRKTQTLYNMKTVAKNVQFSLRKEDLSYGHHALVARMNDDLQAYWLDRAEGGDLDPTDGSKRIRWSVARLIHRNRRGNLPSPTRPSSKRVGTTVLSD